MKTRTIISIFLALLFMLSTYRTGCRIIIDGTVLPGIYEPVTAASCAAMASRTAEEITRSSAVPSYQMIPVLCHRRDITQAEQLYHVLLESYEGVEKLYAVSAAGRQVGLLSELWEVSALLREYPEGTVQVSHIYSHPDAADSLPHVRAAVRMLTGETVDF